ncbi:Uncharacterised protein, partial [Mycoplasma putrefaciens]
MTLIPTYLEAVGDEPTAFSLNPKVVFENKIHTTTTQTKAINKGITTVLDPIFNCSAGMFFEVNDNPPANSLKW